MNTQPGVYGRKLGCTQIFEPDGTVTRVTVIEAGPVVVVANFTPVPRVNYRLGLPRAGRWREILNSDAKEYGGSGQGNLGEVFAPRGSFGEFPASAQILVPPLATIFFEFSSDELVVPVIAFDGEL